MTNNHINYIEFKSKDLNATKAFYSNVFDWNFTDYGPHYTAFSGAGLEGGFEHSEEPIAHGALVILFHQNLHEVIENITQAGGQITQDIFAFPGGQRFHFTDPSGNQLAVWSDV